MFKRIIFSLMLLMSCQAYASEKMHIFYGTDKGYIVHTGVSIASVLLNADKQQEFSFYILTDKSVTPEIREQFKELQKIKAHSLVFIDVDEERFSNLNRYKGSLGTYYRFLIPLVSREDKVLYLDGDTIIRGNLRGLWNTNISDMYLAGIPDYPEGRVLNAMNVLKLNRYFNAGVLLFNLKRIREDGLSDRFFHTMNTIPNVNGWGDQNVINYLFAGKIAPLSQKYNWYERFGFNGDAIIAHFIDGKPWRTISSYAKEYWEIRQKTPWALSEEKIVLSNMMQLPQWKEYFLYTDTQTICPEWNRNLKCFKVIEKTEKTLKLLQYDTNRQEVYELKDDGIWSYMPH